MLVLLISLAIDCLCGYLAGVLMKTAYPWYINIVLGIVGGIVGSLLFGLIGLGSSNLIGSIIVSVVGACIVVYVYNKYIKK